MLSKVIKAIWLCININTILAIPSDIQLRQDFIEICQPFPHLVGVMEAIYER
jgi:hypothetical protein